MKEKIIIAAARLYARYGIKAVSMMEIASELHISKRTLYEHFSKKDFLVSECVRYEIENRKMLINSTDFSSPLQTLLSINEMVLAQILQWSPAFFRDLNSFPTARKIIYEQYQPHFKSRYTTLLESGMDLGIFISDSDVDIIVDFLATQSKITAEKYWAGQQDAVNMHTKWVITFFAGICTDKGREELNEYKSSILQN